MTPLLAILDIPANHIRGMCGNSGLGKFVVPHAFGFQSWFESRFSDLCEQHDIDYSGLKPRRQADCELAGAILARGYLLFAVLTFFFVRIFGVSHYNRRQA